MRWSMSGTNIQKMRDSREVNDTFDTIFCRKIFPPGIENLLNSVAGISQVYMWIHDTMGLYTDSTLLEKIHVIQYVTAPNILYQSSDALNRN